MSKYQAKGIIISLLFIIVGALLGLDLGRIFWIGIVLFGILVAVYYTIWTTIRMIRGKRN
ncbi:MAG TPA: hypothetical protein VJ464_24090 [Blastocatellia bacterium]|nr:hypothetical protein [Blastocatellia bacterium]